MHSSIWLTLNGTNSSSRLDLIITIFSLLFPRRFQSLLMIIFALATNNKKKNNKYKLFFCATKIKFRDVLPDDGIRGRAESCGAANNKCK